MNRRGSWRFADGVFAAALALVAIAATRDVWLDIWRIAIRDEESSYVLLAPFVAGWLAWIRRDRLPYVAPAPSLLGPIAIAGGWWLARAGHRWEIDLAWHFGGLLVVVGAVVSVLGWRVVRAMAPAFLALLFLLPTPGSIRQQIAIPLQSASAQAAQYLLDVGGVAVIRDGNVLKINNHDVAVAEACNGMRMVSALALVTYAFVFSTPMRHRIRFVFLATSPLVALVVNILRLVPTVIAYGYGSSTFADTFHTASGWLMLLLALGVLWMTLSLLRWLEIPLTPFAAAEA